MLKSLRRTRPAVSAWAVASSAFLATAISCGSDRPAGPDVVIAPPPGSGPVIPDSAGPVIPDSTLPPDSTPPPAPPPPDPVPPDSGPPVVPVHVGLPFGPEDIWRDSAQLRWGPAPFTASLNYSYPGWLVEEIDAARRLNHRLFLNLTGGKHARYKTNDKFDLAKWKARMEEYNTPEIKAAVAAGVADGTIVMNSVMDEPNVQSWGGVMTKALLDEMATYVKRIFPTLPVGVALRYDWRPEERFRVMDVLLTQYSWYKGDITTYRDEAVAITQRDGMALAFGINVIDGGIHNWTTRACPTPVTAGPGSYKPACAMTPEQIREWGMILGPVGCGLTLWRFNEEFMNRPANLQVFKELAERLAKLPARPCRRS